MSATTRFDQAYEIIQNNGRPVDVTSAFGLNRSQHRISIAAGEGLHRDDAKRPTSRALGMIIKEIINDPARGVYGVVTDYISLYRDKDGEVEPDYSASANLRQSFAPDINHGFRPTDPEIPEHNKEVALESALIAVEQALAIQAEFEAHAITE